MRWGIAGYGWVARDYMAPGIEAAGGEVVSVADPSEAARAAAEGHGAKGFASLEEMLAEERLEALYVASPNDRHEAAVRLAAAAGVPVLCEKPMAATLKGAEAIASAVAASPALYGTAFDQRYHPGHAALAEAVAAGAVGKVAAVRIVYCCWVDPTWSRGTGENWRADPKAAGGGAVLDLAPHGLDLVQRVLGEEVTDLHISLQNRVHPYAVEDGGVLSGRTPSGILLSMHTAYNTPEALPRRRLEVVGSEAMLVATDTMGQDPGGRLVRIDGLTGERAEVDFDRAASPFARQARAFMAGVRGGTHDFDVHRDLALMRRFFTAYEEARRWL
ncbi:Gfo/Idh/MocA family protein [Parvularcula dongshanensis]|uniref:Putative dehydrogenase n=1 Tax=Parvularcula dongshanensis TaxID=1173995 RepID=A0A840I2E3_9PROT|nr:Gfo/Idh/MocA family oxidoreductase [Parvularcula dongshanensis]MBB4658404.1 putative dehydrogenase [Parvularcula dongshanensis]